MIAPPTQEACMQRCLTLARAGAGWVAPNPLVGAVLVYQDRILAEGYHHRYGEAHAEVDCLQRVAEADKSLIPQSTLYVSLEPCAHFGKTPPCADRILVEGIRKVVIGTRDPFPAVNGKGIEKLEKAGVEVIVGVLEKECRELNQRFFTFHEKKRPYIILKWARSADGWIGGTGPERVFISGPIARQRLFQWRAEEAVILVGTRTALLDDPQLTNRLGSGPQPFRAVVDLDLSLPRTLRLFDGEIPTLIFNTRQQAEEGNLLFRKVSGKEHLIPEILDHLYALQKTSLLVEGGSRLLQSFIDQGLWDEARVITNESLYLDAGTPAPVLPLSKRIANEEWEQDRFEIFKNQP